MLQLTRLPDWDRRLTRVTERHLATPGTWGVADCILTAADAVEAVTGVDPAADVRGTYSTPLGSKRALTRQGAKDIAALLAGLFPETGRLLAQRGDLGVIEEGGIIAAGYVCEYGFAVKTEGGLAFRPQTAILQAFKVG